MLIFRAWATCGSTRLLFVQPLSCFTCFSHRTSQTPVYGHLVNTDTFYAPPPPPLSVSYSRDLTIIGICTIDTTTMTIFFNPSGMRKEWTHSLNFWCLNPAVVRHANTFKVDCWNKICHGFPLNIYLLWNKIIFLCTITLYYRRQRTFIVGSGNNFFFWAGESCLDISIH